MNQLLRSQHDKAHQAKNNIEARPIGYLTEIAT